MEAANGPYGHGVIETVCYLRRKLISSKIGRSLDVERVKVTAFSELAMETNLKEYIVSVLKTDIAEFVNERSVEKK